MITALDHIIIGVNNLEQATRTFNEKLGLITVRAPAEAQQSILDRLSKGEGYLNFVLSSNDIEADSAALRGRGVSITGPTPGQLKAPGGRTRGWSRVDIERPDLAQHYPFLIQHDSTGEERRYRLAGWTTPPAHPLGAIKVLSVTVAVADLEEATS